MSDFLSDLAGSIESEFGLGENETHTLDIAEDGHNRRYGKLGDFANKFDQSQQRQYVEKGYVRLDPYNASPNQLEIMMQEPDITVLVKKRAFASLAENFRLDHMDKDERLFYKATRILFQNKCKQIAALEKLSKINRISKESGQLSTQLMPLIISLIDDITLTDNIVIEDIFATDSSPINKDLGKLKNVIEKVRKLYAFSTNSTYTNWLTASTTLSQTLFGSGTGVIELNNVTQVSTTTTTNPGYGDGGQFNFSISNPYNMMTITNYDIERALSDATNSIYNKKMFQFSNENIEVSIANAKKLLNEKRELRGASAISFHVNPETLLGKKVTAIIDGSGLEINFTYDPALGLGGIVPGVGGVTVSEESFRGGPEVGEEGLDKKKGNSTLNRETGVSIRRLVSTSEVSLFSDVVQRIFDAMQLHRNSESITKQNSDKTNYARRKLRLHYGGKLIVQPMDQIHVYITSKTKQDMKVSGGLKNMFTGVGFLQNLNNQFADVKNQFNSLFSPSTDSNLQLEKSIFVGSDFPNWLWTVLRNQFISDSSGSHVFGGVVTNSSNKFGGGNYTANISGKDNLYYLTLGKVNLKPSIDVFNGPLLDPLTPFKTRYDTLSGSFKSGTPQLLQENQELLKTSFTKFKAGPDAGKKVTDQNIVGNPDKVKNGISERIMFYSPDGFTYRWKEGIGTLTQFSNAFNTNLDNNNGSPSLTKDPFAGQDIMNVISLAITGVPYNFATFYKAAREVNGYGRDPQTGEDASHSFFTSLTTDLQKNNLLWGNFIPFKNLVMDEKSFQQVMSSQATILNTNDLIDQKLIQIKDLNNNLLHHNGTNSRQNEVDVLTSDIQKRVGDLKVELEGLYAGVNSQLKSSNQNLKLAGDDVTFDFDEFLNNDNSNQRSLTSPNIRKELRRKVNFLTRRLSWQVRANEDKNYFIVDDTYDKDYDIAAFEKLLAGADGMKLFDSDFSTVKDKIATVANLLNLEVFCDTQGHIRARPPQYNRVPSSVFARLLALKKYNGVQLYPQFIEDLFEDQIQSLTNQLEIIEDQIRLDCATLGKNTDEEALLMIRGFEGGSGSTLGDLTFNFLSIEGTILEMAGIFTEKDADSKLALKNNAFVGTLAEQASVKNVFNSVARSEFLVEQINSDNTTVAQTTKTSDRINKIITRLEVKTGQRVVLDNLLSPAYIDSISTSPPIKEIDVFKVAKDISIKIAERQKIVKLAANALKNAKEAISLDDDTSTANKLFTPDIAKNSNIPQIFENMLEDETYDDLGPNSGKRYIIKNSQIISIDISEVPPTNTMVEVKGKQSLFLGDDELPADLNVSLTGGGTSGNSQVTAAAVDYDMWRMYGLKSTMAISVPFLSDPISQCAPFAVSILSRFRQDILQANVIIIGNEYMQPGDVVYIEDNDLLFYVEQVNHSFTYGNTFSTTLTLKYGHCPGDYIPTTLDMIGKLLYKNREASTYANQRQSTSFNQQPVGALVLDRRGGKYLEHPSEGLVGGSYGEQNVRIINDILYMSYFAINANKDTNSSVKAKVELRIYYDGKGQPIDSAITQVCTYVKRLLTGSAIIPQKTPVGKVELFLDPADVSDPVLIDVTGDGEFRGPSQKAVDMIRSVMGTASTGGSDVNKMNSILFGYIIDCWVTFESKTKE